jgi:hypothetical protein
MDGKREKNKEAYEETILYAIKLHACDSLQVASQLQNFCFVVINYFVYGLSQFIILLHGKT